MNSHPGDMFAEALHRLFDSGTNLRSAPWRKNSTASDCVSNRCEDPLREDSEAPSFMRMKALVV